VSGGEPHADAIRAFALRFPAAREDHPFGPDAHVFKVGDGSTMFAILGDGPPGDLDSLLREDVRDAVVGQRLAAILRGDELLYESTDGGGRTGPTGVG